MKTLSNYKVQTTALISLSLLIILLILCLGISSIYADSGNVNSLKTSQYINSSNAEAANYLAAFYQILMIEDETQTEQLYIKSLEKSPLYADSWLGLTEVFIHRDEDEKARKTLTRTFELIPSSVGHLWESSLLAFSLGDTELAIDKLGIVAKADPRRRERVFDTAHRLVTDQEQVLDGLVSDELLGHYLGYLIRNDFQYETYPVWSRIEKVGDPPVDVALNYVDYLLTKGDPKVAKRIWAGLYPGSLDNDLIWNGSFEMDSGGRGFDWRIGKADGVDIGFDHEKKTVGDKSLKIQFSGKNNVDFHHVSQIVAVDPNTNYMLTSDISTTDITTRSGLRWQVSCKGMNEFSEIYTGTMDWTTASVSFITPPDCNLIHVRIIRSKSQKLDNLISGEAWIDNVKLLKLEEAKDV